ncbi:hypothetical protein NEHOM01_0740 [Nematocida homosporus]|uniref:uncharacterized protein n=1 Tax=Nematocida homosporus TaxID=1912981 RepID=UPI00221FEF3D|nr:uncharacterized protein NEHOM01_0740 [Nematocida homosporus]KAI5185282.1 hypothetical protein NEHOM01_0740 [Nematocida homosporus]
MYFKRLCLYISLGLCALALTVVGSSLDNSDGTQEQLESANIIHDFTLTSCLYNEVLGSTFQPTAQEMGQKLTRAIRVRIHGGNYFVSFNAECENADAPAQSSDQLSQINQPVNHKSSALALEIFRPEYWQCSYNLQRLLKITKIEVCILRIRSPRLSVYNLEVFWAAIKHLLVCTTAYVIWVDPLVQPKEVVGLELLELSPAQQLCLRLKAWINIHLTGCSDFLYDIVLRINGFVPFLTLSLIKPKMSQMIDIEQLNLFHGYTIELVGWTIINGQIPRLSHRRYCRKLTLINCNWESSPIRPPTSQFERSIFQTLIKHINIDLEIDLVPLIALCAQLSGSTPQICINQLIIWGVPSELDKLRTMIPHVKTIMTRLLVNSLQLICGPATAPTQSRPSPQMFTDPLPVTEEDNVEKLKQILLILRFIIPLDIYNVSMRTRNNRLWDHDKLWIRLLIGSGLVFNSIMFAKDIDLMWRRISSPYDYNWEVQITSSSELRALKTLLLDLHNLHASHANPLPCIRHINIFLSNVSCSEVINGLQPLRLLHNAIDIDMLMLNRISDKNVGPSPSTLAIDVPVQQVNFLDCSCAVINQLFDHIRLLHTYSRFSIGSTNKDSSYMNLVERYINKWAAFSTNLFRPARPPLCLQFADYVLRTTYFRTQPFCQPDDNALPIYLAANQPLPLVIHYSFADLRLLLTQLETPCSSQTPQYISRQNDYRRLTSLILIKKLTIQLHPADYLTLAKDGPRPSGLHTTARFVQKLSAVRCLLLVDPTNVRPYSALSTAQDSIIPPDPKECCSEPGNVGRILKWVDYRICVYAIFSLEIKVSVLHLDPVIAHQPERRKYRTIVGRNDIIKAIMIASYNPKYIYTVNPPISFYFANTSIWENDDVDPNITVAPPACLTHREIYWHPGSDNVQVNATAQDVYKTTATRFGSARCNTNISLGAPEQELDSCWLLFNGCVVVCGHCASPPCIPNSTAESTAESSPSAVDNSDFSLSNGNLCPVFMELNSYPLIYALETVPFTKLILQLYRSLTPVDQRSILPHCHSIHPTNPT